MHWVGTAAGAAASLGLAAAMWTSRWTRYRFWPPGSRDWRWWTYVALGSVATGALVLTGWGDWNSLGLPRPASLVVGALTLGLGSAGFLAATLDLGVEASSGLAGDLRTGGYYRYTRNPQIGCLLVVVAGAVLVANSRGVLAVGAAMWVWFASMPFAEEPWLREQYGDAYVEYCRRVPRFVGHETVRRLREQ